MGLFKLLLNIYNKKCDFIFWEEKPKIHPTDYFPRN